jgi:hypothetical protein
MSRKSLIKYNKINGIIPITIHVQTTHPRLFTQKKQLNENVAKYVAHVWQLKKKITTPFGYAITIFLVPQTPTKKLVNNNNNFWRIWSNVFVSIVQTLVNF